MPKICGLKILRDSLANSGRRVSGLVPRVWRLRYEPLQALAKPATWEAMRGAAVPKGIEKAQNLIVKHGLGIEEF